MWNLTPLLINREHAPTELFSTAVVSADLVGDHHHHHHHLTWYGRNLGMPHAHGYAIT